MLPQSIALGRPGGDRHGPRRRARCVHRRDRCSRRSAASKPTAGKPASSRAAYAINLTPFSLLERRSTPGAGRPSPRRRARAPPDHDRVHRAADRPRHQVLHRQVKALRQAGFGFAVDDAGAGFTSFSLDPALRPSSSRSTARSSTGSVTTTRSRPSSRRSSRSAGGSARSSWPKASSAGPTSPC